MADAANTSGTGRPENVLVGDFRRPYNRARGVPSDAAVASAPAEGAGHNGQGRPSIHDDQAARKLGFRGGTIAGSDHLDQFPPLLTEVYGLDWWRTGTISTYFLEATTHLEPVRAFVQPGAAEATLWMEDGEGVRVLEGTASVAPHTEASLLERRLGSLPGRGETRILADLQAGMGMAAQVVQLAAERQQTWLPVITEPIEYYSTPDQWGRPIATLGNLSQLMRAPAALAPIQEARKAGAVGLFGAIEVKFVGGPVYLDQDYRCDGTILAVGETPKTEYVWHRTWLDDVRSGERVAEMIMMLRFMKASHPAWK